jgi:hypothetical protein
MFEHLPGHFDSKQRLRMIKVQTSGNKEDLLILGRQLEYLLRVISYYGQY